MPELIYDDKYITTKAQVGKDKINAKYFQSNFHFEPIKWSTWDKITIPFYRAKRKIKNVYWNIRYGLQRMFKGYDSVDVFDAFEQFIERYTKILTDLKKYKNGFPCDMTEDEWDGIIDEMIYHLYYMNESNINKELEKYAPDGWLPCLGTTDEIMYKHKDEFFKLFSKYFYNLWD